MSVKIGWPLAMTTAPPAKKIKAAAYRKLASPQTNPNWRNWYISAALELRDLMPKKAITGALVAPGIRSALPAATWVNEWTMRLKAEKTAKEDVHTTMGFYFPAPDQGLGDQGYLLDLRRSIAELIENDGDKQVAGGPAAFPEQFGHLRVDAEREQVCALVQQICQLQKVDLPLHSVPRLLHRSVNTSPKSPARMGKADTTLSDKLNRYNAPPLPSSLQCFPPLGPPLFELVANTSPTFLMSVEWGDIYEALGFAFAEVRIPN